MDKTERLRFLFEQYLQRQCQPEEVEEMIFLLQEAQAEHHLTEPMQQVWEQLKSDKQDYPVDWDRMYAEIDDKTPNLQKESPTWRIWIGSAAACVLLATSILAYVLRSRNEAVIKPALTTAGTIYPVREKRQTIHLPDGSTVILNAESKLNYPAEFRGRTREVYLTGEGYFDIVHNPRQPFLVHCDKITTRVLGTAFNIKAYPGDEAVEITVTRGKVQVMKENKSLGLLTANQQISFSKRTELFAEKPVDAKQVVAWTPKEILFNDITMEDVAREMNARFQIAVEFTNVSIKNCRITASFSEDDLPAEILTVICGVSGSSYTMDGNKAIISGKGCNEPENK